MWSPCGWFALERRWEAGPSACWEPSCLCEKTASVGASGSERSRCRERVVVVEQERVEEGMVVLVVMEGMVLEW